jgi:hypothetical protein
VQVVLDLFDDLGGLVQIASLCISARGAYLPVGKSCTIFDFSKFARGIQRKSYLERKGLNGGGIENTVFFDLILVCQNCHNNSCKSV